MKDGDSLSTLGFLLPGIIHEFKNVLNRIKLLSEHGLQADASAETQRQNLKEITAQVENADIGVISLLNRLLDALERPESCMPTGTESENFLRLPDDVDIFFRILRSSCKRCGVDMTTGDLPSVHILGCDQSYLLLLMDACHGACTIGGAVNVDFAADEDLKPENRCLEMRFAITPPERIEPELYEKFKSEIMRIFDRGVIDIDNADLLYIEDSPGSDQSKQAKLEVRIKLKATSP